MHRDLKPANVMIGSFGEVQVVDWGMGKVLRSDGLADEELAAERQSSLRVIETVRSGGHGSQSMVGSVMGKPAYMPSEQARGDIEAVSPYPLRMSDPSDSTTDARFFPIGTPGRPWSDAERRQWFESCSVQRSYRDEVLRPLERLSPALDVEPYGALSLDPERYPLLCVTSARAGASAPWALVTGGVHGYETSGVQGALAFLAGPLEDYAERINLLVAPCVSPWGYEVIHRWNPDAVDPNRSFVADSPSQEAAALRARVDALGARFLVHLDLHETTDSDETEFRPALAARDGTPFTPGLIPDGFYTVGDSENPQPEFQAALIAGVERVTHIAPPDENGEIIGARVEQHGVIHYPFRSLGLCAGLTDARFTSTTEVYPDSPRVTPEDCNAAQVAAVRAALEHALASSSA